MSGRKCTMAKKRKSKKKRVEVEKKNVVLEKLEVVYLPVGAVQPNQYNPNRQSDHDFELLCKSIAEDGFTQPIVVLRSTKEIVDGEHRWRACKALGFEEVPVVLVDMTPEQMRIATLRHNRARGSEDASLAGEVLRELQALGATDWAADSLMMDDVEIDRLMRDMGEDEISQMEVDIPDEMLGPRGKGLTETDQAHDIDRSADERRAKAKLLAEAKRDEERKMQAFDKRYKLVMHFTGEEARIVRSVLGKQASERLLEICREEAAAAG